MFRIANENDFAFIYNLENKLFNEHIRLSKRSILHSINSPTQSVIILEDVGKVGYLIYFTYPKSIRLYSIGVDPSSQKKGYGKQMLFHLNSIADTLNKSIILEVRVDQDHLVKLYQSFGFIITKTLPNYYGDCDGYKMTRQIQQSSKTVIIVEKHLEWLPLLPDINIVYAHEYMNNPKYQSHNYKVHNLCNSYKYQSIGYYVSLLAVARAQHVIPTLTTIKDIGNRIILRSITDDIDEIIQNELSDIQLERFTIRIYFGHSFDKKFKLLAQKLYMMLELPFMELEFVKYEKWLINKVTTFNPASIKETNSLHKWATNFFNQKQLIEQKLKTYNYNLAILVNPEEITPPSNQKALELFKKAGNNIGFYVEFITKKDYKRLLEFDALLIRETTDVNNHTYDFSRYAYSEGIVVIDDPWSILKCSNKVFLFELLHKNGLPIPKTTIVTKNNIKPSLLKDMNYPIILKQPDSSFSKGVFKADDYASFTKKAKELLKISEMIIVQEFLKSDYDWRIGVLNNEILFACKYYMVEGDWKIINWTDGHEVYGYDESIPLNEVPQYIVDTALKATQLIGDGLYGVDIKEYNQTAKIIEINDNPNIDHGVEDAILGFKLYETIIQDLFDRIDRERIQTKPIR